MRSKLVKETVEIVSGPGKIEGEYHIPGVHNMQQTLCGFVDAYETATHDAEIHPCNCNECIDALKKIQAMKFPRGYFASA